MTSRGWPVDTKPPLWHPSWESLPSLGARICQTVPGPWLVVGTEYPRIGVMGPTRQDALTEFANRKAWWIDIRSTPPTEEPTP